MRHRSPCDRKCSYLVFLDNASGLRELAAYLSEIAISDFEVIIVDGSAPEALEENRRVLRWVGRHLAVAPQHVDVVRAAIDLASCDKVIVADAKTRYSLSALDDLTSLLDVHEVVEPQDYFDPLPWWISPLPGHGSTFGFRKRAVRGLRSLDHNPTAQDSVRRLASQGAEVFTTMRLFVRRIPPAFSEWIGDLPRRAGEELAMPARAALFFMLLPAIIGIALTGGLRMAGAFAGALAFTSIVLAMHGRTGAGRFFPWRACLFAPLWILQRSVSIYFAVLWRVSGGGEPRRIPIAVRADGKQAATGK